MSAVHSLSGQAPPQLGRQSGLTLLEVLAAFLIFALVFTVLVGASQNTVQKQGTSLRRLEAHELAETEIARIEVALSRRITPPIDEEEIDQDPFLIRLRQTALGGADASAPTGGSAGAAPSLDSIGSLSGMLALGAPEIALFVRQYEVEVEWQEGGRREKIQRVTVGIDWEGAQSTLAALAPPGTTLPGPNSGTGLDGADGDEGDPGGNRQDEARGDRGRESSGRDSEACNQTDDRARLRCLFQQRLRENGR